MDEGLIQSLGRLTYYMYGISYEGPQTQDSGCRAQVMAVLNPISTKLLCILGAVAT
jgi:hypothetical protein